MLNETVQRRIAGLIGDEECGTTTIIIQNEVAFRPLNLYTVALYQPVEHELGKRAL